MIRARQFMKLYSDGTLTINWKFGGMAAQKAEMFKVSAELQG